MKKTWIVVFFFLFCICLSGGIIVERFEQDSATLSINPSLFNGLKYRNVGPSRGGRVTAVAGIPSQADTFYMGACGGGVWKTTDYGQSWINV